LAILPKILNRILGNIKMVVVHAQELGRAAWQGSQDKEDKVKELMDLSLDTFWNF
jgi:hypothetical protein